MGCALGSEPRVDEVVVWWFDAADRRNATLSGDVLLSNDR
jgi:hypothetical protein